jgi:hypothetical protein
MQQTHLRLNRTRQRYPWELSEETRQTGRQGLARVRAILDAKIDRPAQQELELGFDGLATPVSVLHSPIQSPPAATGVEPSTLAA